MTVRSYTVPLTKPYFPRSALSADNLEYWIGRREEIDRVVRGLVASTGTHYLITGYPGVGKSSFVSRAISEWRKISAARGIIRLLIFNLHFAQPQTTEEVVRRLIGKVYFASVDGQFAPTKKMADRLELTYIHAQSKSVKEIKGQASSDEFGAEATLNLPKALNLFQGPGISSKKSKALSKSLEVQKEYNVSMATSDFESVLHLLTQPTSFEAGLFERVRRRFSRAESVNNASRVLFVFDQIDDLNFVDQLNSFLNLPNASFIVLGGPKLQQQVSAARELGLHVLDNFDEVYLRCYWDRADETLKSLVDPKRLSNQKYADYRDYLNFCSQGLPRRLLAAMDRHTRREDNRFYLKFSKSEQARIKLCAELHRVLWKHRKDILGSYIDSVQHPLRDKALRGAYQLTDRIFRIIKFSIQDANTVATQMSAAIMHPSRERVLRNLLRVFESYRMLLKNGSEYRLADSVLNQVKEIPDWLTDGFLDVQELLEEIQRLDEDGSGSDPVIDSYVDLTPKPPNSASTSDRNGDSNSDAFPESEAKDGQESGPDQDHQMSPENARDSGMDPSVRLHKEPGPQGDDTHFHVKRSLERQSRWRLENSVLGGRYVVTSLIGRGGVSEVYLAKDSNLLNRPVAIKIVREAAFRNEWIAKKFQQEIEALLRVVHPGIVSILDAGKTTEGFPYIVMDYLDGTTLRDEIPVAGMSLQRASNIVNQVSNALSTVHKYGIIHRDLKPGNIMIRRMPGTTEQVVIIDFGIAKIKDSIVATTTETGLVVGTAAYMSPEQLRGDKITKASDIYALGLITFEMITGRRPFDPHSIVQLSEMQRNGIKVLPCSLCPTLPKAAEATILKALSFDPKDRHRDARDFAGELIRALN